MMRTQLNAHCTHRSCKDFAVCTLKRVKAPEISATSSKDQKDNLNYVTKSQTPGRKQLSYYSIHEMKERAQICIISNNKISQTIIVSIRVYNPYQSNYNIVMKKIKTKTAASRK